MENGTAKIPFGMRLRYTLRQHKGVINGIAWSPDGQVLASASSDKTVILWKASNGELQNKLEDHPYRVFTVVWSPDGRNLVSGSNDKLIRVFQAATGELTRALVADHQWVSGLAWSPDGQILASGSGGDVIQLWDTNKWKLRRTLGKYLRSTNSLVWSPDGSRLGSGDNEGRICIWEIATGKLLRVLEGHASFITSLVWSKNGLELVSASADCTLRIWNPETGWQREVLTEHKSPITSTSFSFDGRLLASKSADNTVRLWRCDIWKTAAVLEEPASSVISPSPGLAFHPNESVLATLGERDRVVRIWNINQSAVFGGVQPSQVRLTEPISHTTRDAQPSVSSSNIDSAHAVMDMRVLSEALKVFLCHSSGDKQAVLSLYNRLKTDGFDPWLDDEKLVGGHDWDLEIRKAVRASDVVAICLSHDSITKAGYVQKEIKQALDVALEQPEGAIFLIPLKLEQCKVPDSLSRYQWINLFDENGYNKLIQALQTRARKFGKAPNPTEK
jgi:WD40 repeat protein